MRRPGADNVAIYVLMAALVIGVFALDAVTHLGFELWVLYFVPFTLSLFAPRPNVPAVLGFACTGLIGAGYLLSEAPPTVEILRLTQINRSIASVALIGLGFVGRQFVLTRARLALQDWLGEGQLQLSAQIRGERSLEDLGRGTLSCLAGYLGAQVGSMHVASQAGAFRRMAGYGLDVTVDQKPDTVVPGQTLVGQVAVDGRILVIGDVPDGYLDVRSGTGAAKPRTLILAPTSADGVVNGIIELGFFGQPSAAARALLTNVAAPVGIAIRSAQYRQRQAELLEETQRQAEELQTQQDELKAVNEELEHQGRALLESRAELEARNLRLEEQARVLEIQKEHLSSAQDVLARKSAEVERASQYKSEFLANMSHELRTPLNSALILAKLLVDNKQGNLSPEQVQYAANIYTAGNDLLTLINDILDLSKVEAGKLDVTFEPVDLARLFAAAKQRFEPLAKDRQLALSVAIAPGCPAGVESDGVRLQQVIANLLSNAIKFTERGAVRLQAAASGAAVRISVEDTGIGIPSHQQGVIFEAFRQADGTTHRKYGGTGLGLSISRELVGLLGGELELISAPGQGSTFTVVLPVSPRKSAPSRVREATSRRTRPDDGRVRIASPRATDDRTTLTDSSRVVLVIEDDLAFAAILLDLAHELQFQCVIAQGADEGLALARQLKPIAIILDIGLPDHSGLTVLELLKRDASVRHIPIQVMTVHDYQQVAREMGAVGYALKPVKREELVAAFHRIGAEIARKRRSILVVEDDAVQREAIAKLLGSDAVVVIPAPSAEEAFDRLGAETFDCVVLDLMLPGASGFELLDRMATSMQPPFPPVIIYTARALTLDEEQRLRRYASSIIVKGARSPERLLEEVTLFLHQVAADLPEDKRRMLRRALDRDAVFTGRRILIVEDDIRSIFALTSALEPRGAVIEVARNGKEVLRRLESLPHVDIVLMDIMMPEMDGLTATREIRKAWPSSSLPIIALTAKAMPDDRQQCLQAGANDYIAKPVDVEKLISLCRVWMPRG